MKNLSGLTCAAIVLMLASCAEPPRLEKARADMTRREKDSIIGASRLPGSGVVRKAMSVADGEAKRAAMYDSAGGQ